MPYLVLYVCHEEAKLYLHYTRKYAEKESIFSLQLMIFINAEILSHTHTTKNNCHFSEWEKIDFTFNISIGIPRSN